MEPGHLSVRVACCAGHRGEDTPQRFYLGERAVDVQEVLDRWLGPDHRYFKLIGNDGSTYILRQDTVADRWELTMYQRG